MANKRERELAGDVCLMFLEHFSEILPYLHHRSLPHSSMKIIDRWGQAFKDEHQDTEAFYRCQKSAEINTSL